MQLSNIGVLADVFWHEIKNYSKNIKLHEFIVMPNHVHGILEIIDGGDDGIGNDGDVAVDNCRDVACNVSTITNDHTITNDDIITNENTNISVPKKNQQMS